MAVVIGNNTYPKDSVWPCLDKPDSDAETVAKKLVDLGFKVYDKHYDLNKEEMEEAVGWLAGQLRTSEVKDVVFYYAGHGCTHRNWLYSSNIP